jgi:hypothetical protein
MYKSLALLNADMNSLILTGKYFIILSTYRQLIALVSRQLTYTSRDSKL